MTRDKLTDTKKVSYNLSYMNSNDHFSLGVHHDEMGTQGWFNTEIHLHKSYVYD